MVRMIKNHPFVDSKDEAAGNIKHATRYSTAFHIKKAPSSGKNNAKTHALHVTQAQKYGKYQHFMPLNLIKNMSKSPRSLTTPAPCFFKKQVAWGINKEEQPKEPSFNRLNC